MEFYRNSKLEKLINARSIASVLYEILKKVDPSDDYAPAPGSIQLNRDEETGELLDMVTLTEETHKRNSDETFVDKKAELIVEKEGRLTQLMSQGDDSVQSNHLIQAEIEAIYKDVTHLIERCLKFIYFLTIMLYIYIYI